MDKKLKEANWLRFAGVLLFIGGALTLYAGLRDGRVPLIVSGLLQICGWLGFVSSANEREQEAVAARQG